MEEPVKPHKGLAMFGLTIMILIFAGFFSAESPSPASAIELQKSAPVPLPKQPLVPVSAPDLIVSSISYTIVDGSANRQIVVTDTTRNIGSAPTLKMTTTSYYLSKDQVVGDDIYLGGRVVPGGLNRGMSNTGSVFLNITNYVASGSYYVLACADANKAVQEINEGNNCRFSTSMISVPATPVQNLSDLIVEWISEPPANISAGNGFVLRDQVFNTGFAPTSHPVSVDYYLSPDLVVSGGVYRCNRIVGKDLLQGGRNTGTCEIDIPDPFPDGSYYVRACLDMGKTIPEINKGNNCMFTTGKVTVRSPDLIVTSITDPPLNGSRLSQFKITDTTRNIGSVPTALDSATVYSLSTDQVVGGDVYLGLRVVAAGLGPGADNKGEALVTIPSTIPIGSYYLVACANGAGHPKVGESNRQNNCRFSTTKISIGQ
jgi:CARDB